MPEQLTPGQLNDIVRELAARSPEYRRRFLADPKAMLNRQLGVELPDFINVVALEERPGVMYLTVPHVLGDGDELSDADLEMVVGGKGKGGDGGSGDGAKDVYYTCNNSSGMATRVDISTTAEIG